MGYNEHVLWIQAENIEIIYILYCVSTSALNFQDLLYIFNIMYMVDYVASTLKLVKWKPCIFAITGFTNIQRFLKHISLFPCVILLQIYLISYPHLYHLLKNYIKQRKSILRSNTCTLIFQSHILWYLPTRFATIKMEDILTVAQKK